MSPPPSPPATRLHRPSWLDLRLVLGIMLVLVSVLVGSTIVARADRSVQVWSLARDVAPGTALAAADLRPARVRLFDGDAAYVQVDLSPTGRVVTRQLRTGELLPVAALEDRPPAAVVGIPVKPENAPGVARGQLVDVWATGKGCAPVQVLAGVAVQDVRASGGGALSVSTGAVQVVVRVGADDARRMLTALGTESTIRLVVLDGPVPPRRPLAVPADACGQVDGLRGVPGETAQAPAGNSGPTVTPEADRSPEGSARSRSAGTDGTPPASPGSR